MTGASTPAEILNATLKKIVQLLDALEIENWFISYGTLLGITRADSCINGDDDVDINCDAKAHDVLVRGLIDAGFELMINNPGKIIKTVATSTRASVDFYMSHVSDDGNYNDTWEKVVWTGCTPLVKKAWGGVVLQMPRDMETKLEGRYGERWRIPQNNKGPSPRKTQL